jgi:very-short-patch-repair endonuclease
MDRFKRLSRALRASQTGAEARLWQALRARRLSQWKFRRQHRISRYVVDFATIDGKLVVEVDGATHSNDAEQKRDTARTRELERCGFHVFRVTNVDVYQNLEGVLDAIERELNITKT